MRKRKQFKNCRFYITVLKLAKKCSDFGKRFRKTSKIEKLSEPNPLYSKPKEQQQASRPNILFHQNGYHHLVHHIIVINIQQAWEFCIEAFCRNGTTFYLDNKMPSRSMRNLSTFRVNNYLSILLDLLIQITLLRV